MFGQITPVRIEPVAIVYKPHCARCGFPIDTDENEITYQDVYSKAFDVMIAKKVGINVYPDKCAHCGAIFNKIEIPMPKQLNDMFLED